MRLNSLFGGKYCRGISLVVLITLTALCGAQIRAIGQVNTESERSTSEIEPLTTSDRWKSARFLHTLKGHRATVHAVVFSPDSKIIASGSGNNEARIKFWDVEKRRELIWQDFRAQRVSVLTMASNPQQEVLISSGEDNSINLWNWKTRESQRIFLDNFSSILSLKISPDMGVLVGGGLDGIRVWDARFERPIYTLAGIGNPTHALAISPNGHILASGDNLGRVRFWDLREGKLISEFFPHQETISGLIFTPDGNSLITSSHDRTIKAWDLTTEQLSYTLIGHTEKIRAIAITRDGTTLASASNDGIRVWEVKSGKLLNRFLGHEDWVASLAFSPNGRLLASGGFDTNILVWGTFIPGETRIEY